MLDFIKSKTVKIIFAALGIIIVILLVFQLGVFVGLRKAGFACGWGKNYSQNFGMPQRNPLGQFEGREFFGGHGVAGEIIKVENQTLVVKGRDGIERIIKVLPNTSIRRGREAIKISDIQTDDGSVTIGEPNADGTISAKLIRIFDEENLPPQPPFNNQINPNPNK